MAVDLQQLRYFVRVAELKSFTKAARSLHVAQPAITRQVKLLEEDLGVPLLFRHSRGAEPTEAGLRMLAGADALFRMLQDTRAEVVASSSLITGTLRIGFPPSLSYLLMSSAIATFRQRHPDVMLTLQEGYSQTLRDSLLGDRLDLAVLSGQPRNPLLVDTHLLDEPLWILCPLGGLPPSRGKSYHFKEVATLPLIQPNRSNTLRQMMETRASELGVQLNVVIEAEALHSIKHLVRRGVGCHMSPFSGVAEDIERAECSGAPIRGIKVARHLVRRIDRPVSPALLTFQKLLLETVGELRQRSRRAG